MENKSLSLASKGCRSGPKVRPGRLDDPDACDQGVEPLRLMVQNCLRLDNA